MKKLVLIIEDEPIAAERLQALILEVRPGYQIINILTSISDVIKWFGENKTPDLIFLDIHLSDGLSFSIFKQVQIEAPIIFTTAYDQYALDAFQLNSIDYLLKPIEPTALENAINKYEKWERILTPISSELANQLIESLNRKKYRSRFLVKSGNKLEYLTNEQICFFYIEEGVLFARTTQNKRYMLDASLDQLETMIDPTCYFRINRKVIIHIQAISIIHPYLNSRFKIDPLRPCDMELIVARERAGDFRRWLDETGQ